MRIEWKSLEAPPYCVDVSGRYAVCDDIVVVECAGRSAAITFYDDEPARVARQLLTEMLRFGGTYGFRGEQAHAPLSHDRQVLPH